MTFYNSGYHQNPSVSYYNRTIELVLNFNLSSTNLVAQEIKIPITTIFKDLQYSVLKLNTTEDKKKVEELKQPI